MHAADAFIPLAELLRPRPAPPPPEAAEPPEVLEAERVDVAPETVDAVRSARIFSAALADAFDAVLAQLVRDLAADVLARELLLAPADVGAIARRLLEERAAELPVRLRIAPADADVACALPVVVDRALRGGDAILECAGGSIDARLGVRLADVMQAAR